MKSLIVTYPTRTSVLRYLFLASIITLGATNNTVAITPQGNDGRSVSAPPQAPATYSRPQSQGRYQGSRTAVPSQAPAPPAVSGGNSSGTVSSSEKRVALVIGNNAYISLKTLKKAVNDAKAVAGTLRNLGFEVVYAENISKQQLDALLNQFSTKLRGAGLGLFYFAGHGTQYGNENFLIPVDLKIESEKTAKTDIPDNSLHASQVLAVLEQVNVPTKILILDACRNWSETWDGLAPMKSPAKYTHGTFIAFSTEPGTTASDGAETDINSPYTKALVKYMPQGLPIEMMFKKVRSEVLAATKGAREQTPWEYNSLEGGSLCLAPCVEAAGSNGGKGNCKLHVGQGLYDGECQNNIPHGRGVIRYSDGEYYQGSFSNGVRHGPGVQYLTDGTEVRGVWVNGRLK